MPQSDQFKNGALRHSTHSVCHVQRDCDSKELRTSRQTSKNAATGCSVLNVQRSLLVVVRFNLGESDGSVPARKTNVFGVHEMVRIMTISELIAVQQSLR
jgi:hypothetical protein